MRLCNRTTLTAILAGTTLLLPAQQPPGFNVRIPVTVTDHDDHPATGLTQDNFLMIDNGKDQQIRTVDGEDTPASIGIVLDLSGSMGSKLAGARYAILQLMKTSNPQDEFLLVGFKEQPELIAGFTSSEAEIETGLAHAQAGHRTALLDAILFGLEKMKSAHYERKVLLVISDGGDNRSLHSEGDVRAAVRKSDVQIDSIGVFDRFVPLIEDRLGPQFLANISLDSGGRLIRADNDGEWGSAAETISALLRHQYVIGYVPGDLNHDGKWRKVKVKVNPPPGLPLLSVYARSGYYAPSQ